MTSSGLTKDIEARPGPRRAGPGTPQEPPTRHSHVNKRIQWQVLPIVAGLGAGLLTGCGTDSGGSGSGGSSVVVGMSDDVLATDPASGYDPDSWLLFNNVFQSLLSF